MSTHLRTLTVSEAIESRRSIRRYEQEPIPKEDLQAMLRLAGLAPSAWNVQPWRFHVVTNPELKARLKEAAYGQQQIGSAPAVIVVSSDMEDVLAHLEETVHPGMSEERRKQEVSNLGQMFGTQSVEQRGQWGLTQTNIALGFLMLAAQGLGYSTSPMLGFDPVKVREILGLPEHVKFAAMLCVGVAAEAGFSRHRHPLERIVIDH